MTGSFQLFDANELAKRRRDVVAFWSSCIGIDESEIARRLNLSVLELRYIFAEQLEDGPIHDADAVIALYNRAISGDADAAFVWLATTPLYRDSFAELLAMPDRAHWA